jgi:hypothetical protein
MTCRRANQERQIFMSVAVHFATLDICGTADQHLHATVCRGDISQEV